MTVLGCKLLNKFVAILIYLNKLIKAVNLCCFNDHPMGIFHNICNTFSCIYCHLKWKTSHDWRLNKWTVFRGLSVKGIPGLQQEKSLWLITSRWSWMAVVKRPVFLELAGSTNPNCASCSSRELFSGAGSPLLPTRLSPERVISSGAPSVQCMWGRISPGPVLFTKQIWMVHSFPW